MRGLRRDEELLEQLSVGGADDTDVQAFTAALVGRLARASAWRLVHVAWRDGYLDVELVSEAGKKVDLTYGDGFLDLEIGDLEHLGYLEGEELARLVVSLIDGRVEMVRRSRCSLTVETFLQTEESRWFTRDYQLPGALLAFVPWLPDRFERHAIR